MFIFTFSFKPETNEAAYAGNIDIQQALQILQQLAIADAVRKAREADKQSKGENNKEKSEENNKEKSNE